MSVLVTDDAVRVGRDPSGATWLPFGRRDQWENPELVRLVGVVYDSTRDRLELAPSTPLDPESSWVPVETVRAPDGSEYRSDPQAHRVLVRGPCADHFTPIPCFGGRGTATGQLQRPLGLAVDRRGWLYVADADNHRVQVVRPSNGEVVYVLGTTDVWGRPTTGAECGMLEPVDVALDEQRGRLYVADRGAGLIHLFDARFRCCRSISPEPRTPRPPARSPARPLAIAVDADGSLLVADANWPRLLRLSPDGATLGELALNAAEHPRFVGLKLRQGFELEGYTVIGPLDSGGHDSAWHRVAMEVDTPGASNVVVQTFASDDASARSAVVTPADEAAFPWAPQLERAVRFEAKSAEDSDRLVLSHAETATDRGRYLWIRLTLRGGRAHAGDVSAVDTPSVRALRAYFPRDNYLRLLPAVFARRLPGDLQGAVFPERFLALFEFELTKAAQRYENFSGLINPRAASEPWLSWLSGWMDLYFDPSWDEPKRRALLLEAHSLYRRRGTAGAIVRYLEIYTGKPPALIESFRRRPRAGGVLGCNALLGCSPLGGPLVQELETERALSEGAHHFTLIAFADDCEQAAQMEPVLRKIVDSEKPAHTSYDLCIVIPDARVGVQSSVGVDFVLGSGDAPRRGLRADTTSARLGHDSYVSPAARERAVRIDDATRLDERFNLA